jgi:hypothetical protein
MDVIYSLRYALHLCIHRRPVYRDGPMDDTLYAFTMLTVIGVMVEVVVLAPGTKSAPGCSFSSENAYHRRERHCNRFQSP